MRKHRWLNERDRDIYEAELMYDAWLEGNLAADRAYFFRRQVEGLLSEGYDPDRDDPNGWQGADERERDVRGEQ